MQPIVLALTIICFATSAVAEVQPIQSVDRSTLTGKVMVGYQGWFNCDGDGANLGWTHWTRNRSKAPAPGNITVDLWPDVSELDADERYATDLQHADGRVAELFSSRNRKTVWRHFKWMQDYGIDGAFVQRFAAGLAKRDALRNKNAVLWYSREGANRFGRTFAVMYDLSGLKAGDVDRVREDWLKLRSTWKIGESNAYQHHDGKPLVAVWGIGFKDRHEPGRYTLADCRELIIWLKEAGCSVMLGVPTGWRDLNRDTVDNAQLHEILKLADIISPWTPGRYRNPKEVARHAGSYWSPDVKWCAEENLDYLPVVFPGFSWHNLKGEPLGAIPRLKGRFLWSQVVAAKRSGCEMIYVAMFDEVDEGTAIFKCTNAPPIVEGVPFLTYEGLPSDHYLKLVGHGGRLLRGEVPLSDELPKLSAPHAKPYQPDHLKRDQDP